jgi:uncharacterized protein involved in exopolysaccharide biosynthesis
MHDESNFDGESGAQDRAPDPIETLVMPLWRAKWWIVALGIVGVGIGAFKAAILINTYGSSGKLMVRAGVRESATPESLVVTGGTGGQTNAREAMANEIHLLRDPAVFRRTVALVGPERILAPYDPSVNDGPDTPFLERTLHRFQTYWSSSDTTGSDSSAHVPDDCAQCASIAEQVVALNLSIYPEPGSSIITVSYSAHTPRLAANVTSAFLKAAIAHHQEFFRSGTELELIALQAQEAQAELHRVESAQAVFYSECGVYDLTAQSSDVMREHAALEADIVTGTANEGALKAKKAHVDELLGKEKANLATTTEQAPLPNPLYTFLLQQKLQLELTPLGDSGGSVQRLEALQSQRAEQLRQLEARIAVEPERIKLDPLRQLSPNPLYQELLKQSRDTEGELLALVESQAIRRARLEQLRDERLHLESCRGQSTSLDRDLEAAKLRLAKCTQAHQNAMLFSSLDKSNLTNLQVLQDAIVPRTKSGPKRGRMLLIGGLLGGAAGAALSLLWNKLDRRVRRAGDLERWAGVPVLETVPEAKLPRPKRAMAP